MTMKRVIKDYYSARKLYTVEGLQKALYSLGYSIPKEDLYTALHCTGWIKLRLIRDRLLEIKAGIPKRYPFDGLRHLVKYPLLVERGNHLPEMLSREKEKGKGEL